MNKPLDSTTKKVILLRHFDFIICIFYPKFILAITGPKLISAILILLVYTI